MRIFLSFFILIFLAKSIAGFAQNPCAIALSEAEDKYDQGRLYDIEGILKECLKDFTNEEKVRAYRLLTLTYLFLNYEEEADSSFLKLLNVNPIYETDEDLDPLELINHGKKFTTKPKYILSGKIGLNISQANVLLPYSIWNKVNESGTLEYPSKYSMGIRLIAGIGGEMVIWKDLHLVGEIFYSGKSVQVSESYFGFYTTNMKIIHRELEFPIMLKYNFHNGKVNPFCFAGVSPSFIAKSLVNNIKGESWDEIDGKLIVQLPSEVKNTTRMKNRFNYNVLLGGGINYKIGLNYLVLEARYSIGMLNVTDEENRFYLGLQKVTDDEGKIVKKFSEGRELKFPVGHIDDDFKLNNLSFLVGFVRPLYRPRKIK